MNTAYVLLRPGYADWEAASALAELRRTFGFAVKTIGLAAETVVSMGGLKVMPDLPLSAFVPESADILILPGGESWTDGEVPRVSEVVRAMVTQNRPVAAICAATLALAHVGCSTIVCIQATARTSSGSMSTSIVGKNSIGRRRRCVIDVLSQQVVWLPLRSQLRYSEHWHLDENAISRPTRSSTRVGCLIDRALR
jgi:hypothetical protein